MLKRPFRATEHRCLNVFIHFWQGLKIPTFISNLHIVSTFRLRILAPKRKKESTVPKRRSAVAGDGVTKIAVPSVPVLIGRFSTGAANAFDIATRAREVEFSHARLGPEHMLYGVVSRNRSRAATTLVHMGITADVLRPLVATGPTSAKSRPPSGRVVTRELHAALVNATDQPLLGNYGNGWITAEHLLLGLLGADQRIVPGLLRRLERDPDAIRTGTAELVRIAVQAAAAS